MRALLLVDLDNVPAAAIRRGVGGPFAAESARVVFLLNLDTARGDPDPQDLGARLAAACAARLEGVEVVLVAPVPQAADAMLLPILERAPVPEGAGAFGAVAVLSRDRGLRDELAARLSGHRPRRTDPGAWTAFVLPTPLGRRQLPSARRAGAGEIPEHYSAAVHTAAAAAAVASHPVESPAGAGLAAVAAAVRAVPHVLTQVGPTTTSLRGVARLGRVLAGGGTVPIGPVAEAEGLEVHRGPAAPPPTRVVLGPAPGLARLVGEERTVLCRVPPSAMPGLAAADFAPGPDGDLEAMRTLRALGGEGRVRFEPWRKDGMAVRIRRPTGEPPPIWWVDGISGKATSERKLRLGGVKLPRPFEACARVAWHRDPYARGLRLVAPPTRSVRVRVERRASAGEIVRADHDGRPFAALALRTLPPGEYDAAPIATVPHNQLLPALGDDLRAFLLLPLLVIA